MEAFLPPYLQDNSLVKMARDTIHSFSQRREALGLSNPGTVDKIKREVDTDVFLSKYMFTGLKADFNRPLSMLPLFQYSHSFALGSQIPPYGFSALFGTQGVCSYIMRPAWLSSHDVAALTLLHAGIYAREYR